VKAVIPNAKLPRVGIRGEVRDLYDGDENGDHFPIGFQVSQEEESNLDVYFTGEDAEVRVKVACSLVGGVLAVDIIDYARLGPDDVPCGAEAVATASIRINAPETDR